MSSHYTKAFWSQSGRLTTVRVIKTLLSSTKLNLVNHVRAAQHSYRPLLASRGQPRPWLFARACLPGIQSTRPCALIVTATYKPSTDSRYAQPMRTIPYERRRERDATVDATPTAVPCRGHESMPVARSSRPPSVETLLCHSG